MKPQMKESTSDWTNISSPVHPWAWPLDYGQIPAETFSGSFPSFLEKWFTQNFWTHDQLDELLITVTKGTQRAHNNKNILITSYVTLPPDEDCWRKVTLEIAPLAEITHTALGPCWANDIILFATSCRQSNKLVDRQ